MHTYWAKSSQAGRKRGSQTAEEDPVVLPSKDFLRLCKAWALMSFSGLLLSSLVKRQLPTVWSVPCPHCEWDEILVQSVQASSGSGYSCEGGSEYHPGHYVGENETLALTYWSTHHFQWASFQWAQEQGPHHISSVQTRKRMEMTGSWRQELWLNSWKPSSLSSWPQSSGSCLPEVFYICIDINPTIPISLKC